LHTTAASVDYYATQM